MEKRKNPEQFISKPKTKSTTDLPVDFTKMVCEVLTKHYKTSLDLIESDIGERPSFSVSGNIFGDEIVMSVSLGLASAMAHTTLHISSDFDPKASFPSAQDLLAVSVDAAGAWYESYLGDQDTTKERRDALTAVSLAAFEPFGDVPYDWAEIEVEKRKVFLKLDKSNSSLEAAADHWLAAHDPDYQKEEMQEEIEVQSKFVTGPSKKNPPRH